MLSKKVLSTVLAAAVLTTVYAPAASVVNSGKVYAADTYTVANNPTVQNVLTELVNQAIGNGTYFNELVDKVLNYAKDSSALYAEIKTAAGLSQDQIDFFKSKTGLSISAANDKVVNWINANKAAITELKTITDKVVLKNKVTDLLNSLKAHLAANGINIDDYASYLPQSGLAAFIKDYTGNKAILTEDASGNLALSNTDDATYVSVNTVVYNVYAKHPNLNLTAPQINSLFNYFNGKFKSLSNYSDVLTLVKAYLTTTKGYGLYSKPITQNGGNTGGNTSGGTTTTTDNPGTISADAQKALDVVNAELKNLDPKDQKAVDKLKADVADLAAKALDLAPTVSVKDNTATVTVDKAALTADLSAIADVIAKAKAAGVDVTPADLTVTIDVPKDKAAAVTVASLPQDILKLIADAKVAFVDLKTADGQVTIPVSVLNTGKDITVKVTKVTSDAVSKDLTDAAKKLGGKFAPVAAFSYEIKSGTDTISQFTTPVKVTLNADDTKVDKVVNKVFYIAPDGTVKYVGGTWATGNITFTTKHFSEYALLGYTKDFNDTASNWVKTQPDRYLDQAVVRLIAQGDTKGNFNPDKNITRADFTSMLVRALGVDTKAYAGTFTDVKDGAYYAPEVEAAKAAGLVDGVGNNKFDPTKAITREEMAKIITNAYSKLTGKSVTDISGTADSKFTDFAKVSTWAQNYVKALENLSVVNGYTDGSFKPADSSTRAESVKTVVALLNKAEAAPTATTPAATTPATQPSVTIKNGDYTIKVVLPSDVDLSKDVLAVVGDAVGNWKLQDDFMLTKNSDGTYGVKGSIQTGKQFKLVKVVADGILYGPGGMDPAFTLADEKNPTFTIKVFGPDVQPAK